MSVFRTTGSTTEKGHTGSLGSRSTRSLTYRALTSALEWATPPLHRHRRRACRGPPGFRLRVARGGMPAAPRGVVGSVAGGWGSAKTHGRKVRSVRGSPGVGRTNSSMEKGPEVGRRRAVTRGRGHRGAMRRPVIRTSSEERVARSGREPSSRESGAEGSASGEVASAPPFGDGAREQPGRETQRSRGWVQRALEPEEEPMSPRGGGSGKSWGLGSRSTSGRAARHGDGVVVSVRAREGHGRAMSTTPAWCVHTRIGGNPGTR